MILSRLLIYFVSPPFKVSPFWALYRTLNRILLKINPDFTIGHRPMRSYRGLNPDNPYNDDSRLPRSSFFWRAAALRSANFRSLRSPVNWISGSAHLHAAVRPEQDPYNDCVKYPHTTLSNLCILPLFSCQSTQYPVFTANFRRVSIWPPLRYVVPASTWEPHLFNSSFNPSWKYPAYKPSPLRHPSNYHSGWRWWRDSSPWTLPDHWPQRYQRRYRRLSRSAHR